MRDSRWHAPEEAWRSTIMSGAIASRFSAVSTSVSPLTTLDVGAAMLSVSALSRFSAISNDVRVRVLGSKNRLTTVLPRSVGTFLIGRSPISRIASAVSRMSSDLVRRQIRDAEQILVPQLRRGATCRVVMGATSLRLAHRDFVGAVGLRQTHLDALA